MQDYREFIDEVLVDTESIEKRVAELGAQISQDYAGEELLIVCMLRGGITFTADLTRFLTIPHTLDCMSLSSYGVGHYASSGNVRVNFDLMTNIEGRNVLLVEDIVDTGFTARYLMQTLAGRGPNSISLCTMLDRTPRRIVPLQVDFCCFEIPDRFVIGCGLDYKQLYRNLDFIAVMKADKA